MKGDATVFVKCFREGVHFRTYDYLVPASMGSPAIVQPNDHYIAQAKEALVAERHAGPLCEGITFEFTVRRHDR